jgi:NAD(P)-dependent dehydrogenase (short-subunit alcohol dehydrogenase family)
MTNSTPQGADQKVALVTGANRGLGLEVARQSAQQGFVVILGCRTLEKATAAAEQLRSEGLTAHGLAMDVASADSIAAAAQTLITQWDHLDVLVNNAAIHYDSWQQAMAPDFTIVEEAWQTNLLGPWQVTTALLPLLKQSSSPRIVNVSSEGGSLASMGAGTPAYSVTKAGLNALTRTMAAELKGEGFLVNAVCPGWTATDMGGGGRPIPEGAKSIVWAALLPDDGPTGGFFRDGQPLPW